VVGRDEVGALLHALSEGSAPRLLELSAELSDRNADFADVLRGMLEALHQATVAQSIGTDHSNQTVGEQSSPFVGLFDLAALHLLYQIALIGSRDLQLAPDERSGFEMTLLRMLSFSPTPASEVPPLKAPPQAEGDHGDGGSQSRAQTQQDSPEQTQVQTSVRAQAATPHRAQSDRVDPQAADVAEIEEAETVEHRIDAANQTPSAEQNDAWASIIAELDIGGVVRVIAEHSVPTHYAPPQVELILDRGHDTLLSDAQCKHLERALSEHLQTAVSLSIQIGDLPAESPAQRRERLQQERQASAEATMSDDANVQTLLSEFGGRVEEIRPV